GFFVNSLVLRAKLAQCKDFFELTQHLQNTLREVWQHQSLPFEQLVNELGLPRQNNMTPLFQHMFVWQGEEQSLTQFDALQVEPQPLQLANAKYDLTLTLSEKAGQIHGELEYRSACFKEDSMRQFIKHFEQIAQQVLNNPGLPLTEVSLLSEDDRALLRSFNVEQPQPDWQERSIVQRFEAQVARFAQGTALRGLNQQQTYLELNQRANQLAHYLVTQGVKPRQWVAVSYERSAELIVAILAVLKCGAAYVPIDPHSAATRIAMILGDADPTLILCDAKRDCYGDKRIIDSLELQAQLGDYSSANLNLALDEHSPAYMIYTSGTTGKPKGVVISHHNVLRLFSQSMPPFEFSEHDCWTLFHSFAFDFSVWEIWGALFYGGALVLVSLDEVRDPEQFYALLQREKVTVLNQTPSAFYQLVSIDQQQTTSNLALRYVIFGGEALNFTHLKPWVNRHGFDAPQLINMYGITETTVHVTWHRLCEHDFLDPVSNIGRPLADLGIVLLNDSGQQVKPGVVAEIFVFGRGLSEGYWQRPELNAERFVTRLLDGKPVRLYKSGDLAYYRANGDLIYVGRNDEQVKIRGYRIELGEINAQIKNCEGVKSAAVISDEDKKQLLAFVVFEKTDGQNSAQQLAQLRAQLEEKLPSYMLPAFIYDNAHLPLTHNGKLDKRALLAQHQEARHSGGVPATLSERIGPRNHHETVLAQVWREVLGLEWVGVFDNFFELGGDSILSLQIVSRSKKAGVSISAKQLFEFQTIAALAEVARLNTQSTLAEQEALSGELALLPIQHWFFAQVANHTIKAPQHWNQSLLFSLKQPLELSQLQQAWRLIIEKHDQLRCHFRCIDGQWTGFYKNLADMPDCVSEHACKQHELSAVIATYQTRLHIEQGPLQQVVLLRCEEQSYLFMTLHHLIVDGVSWRILLEDLHTLLEHPQPELALLGQKTTSMREAHALLQARLAKGDFAKQQAYWLAQVEDNGPLLPELARISAADAPLINSVEARLDSDFTGKLLHDACGPLKLEARDLLICALVLSLKKWSGQQCIRLDLESHGRDLGCEQADLSQTIGWFTALYPQRFVLKDQHTLAAQILAAKEQLRAIPEQGLAYGWLTLNNSCPSLVDAPADVLFNYLGQADRQDSAWLEWAEGFELNSVGRDNRSLYPLEINAVIQAGELSVRANFDASLLASSAVEQWLSSYLDVLKGLLVFCCDARNFAYSPSDFPLLKISNDGFEPLITRLSAQDEQRSLEAIYPLTPMQQGMLFHALFDESGETYFEQIYIELQGELYRDALAWAWAQVLARHPMLRTGFVWDDEPGPLQFVRVTVENPIIEYSTAGHASISDALSACLAAERQRGFALDQASLIRLGLLKKAENAYYLVLNFHHLILDGWSMSLVLNELFQCYQQACAGTLKALPPGPAFEPFVRHLSVVDAEAAENYWKKQLGEFERATPLPGTESSLPEATSPPSSYATEIRQLPKDLSQALDVFCKRHHLTLNTLFQAAWAYLLSAYAGEKTVVFGTTVAGRPAHLPHIEQTVGMFINTLPCVIALPDPAQQDSSILHWLEKIQQQQLAMQPFEQTSLSQLQQLCRLGGGEHLFESILVFENYPVDQALSSDQLPFVVGEVNAVWKTNFPLTIIFIPGASITLKMSYQENLFRQQTVQELMQRMCAVLAYLVAHSGQAVHQITLLSAAERQRLLHDWNQSGVPYPAQSTIAEQFDLLAAAQPYHPALWCDDNICSYQSLATQANQLAHHLIAMGVGPETVVAFCGERSLNMVVSLLAILKAGGAYLPIDPNYPDERIRYMLADARAEWVIYQPEFKARLDGVSLPLIDASVSYAHLPPTSPVNKTKSENLALVIYTSGSTGQPKGIELTQRNVLRLVKSSNVTPLNSNETLLHYAPIAFDAATYEIWGALLNGAKLVLAPRGHLDPETLGELIRQQGISTVFLTTALFHTVVEYYPEALAPLRVVMTGGEVVDPARVKTLLKNYPHLRFVNLYGPSENTTLTSYYSPADADSIQGALPIGYPVSNTQVYVLDSQLQPVPPGVAGELCMAGDGIARAYRFKPALTRQVFVPNPFAAEFGHGPLLYRSGDLARFRADGALEFLGRRDQQVKIRGHRIELGEIESAIKQTASAKGIVLRDVIVRAQKMAHAKQLLAWCVLEEINTLSTLKQAVSQRLPTYML
ncbi:MAG TPA: amino acid adenylation domain-containing protein, partial [Pseudomonadales bacterium]|nr:amino acid adenylation domain-containing protein [Pseudomonadales bacterium]